jgi:hypothetical protein
MTTGVITEQPQHATQQTHAHRGNTHEHQYTQEKNEGAMVNWLAMLLDWQVLRNSFEAVSCKMKRQVAE